jgi:6-pyruvoyl-tetrahydropterin synthase
MVMDSLITATDHTTGTLFVDDVDRIDCAVFDPSIGVVGQSWFVDIEVSGQLDDNGFVYDFSHLKKMVKAVLKKSVDHALLIPIMSKHVHFQDDPSGEFWQLKAKTRLTGIDSDWTYKCPKGAVYPVRAVKVTREALEQECTKVLRHRLGQDISRVQVRLRPEEGQSGDTFFRYTHGITQHEGACQRLFHGHRSRLRVYVADERRHDLEQYIAHDIFGSIVHIASIRQVISGVHELRARPSSPEPVTLGYEGSYGNFQATIPANRIFFVEQATSIECLTQEIATLLAHKTNERATIRVCCFEGIEKGAIAEA